MEHCTVLCSSQCTRTKVELLKKKDVPFASAVGSIMYAIDCTRPDLDYDMSTKIKYQQNQGMSHWIAMKKVLKYLPRTKDMFLIYGDVEESLSVMYYIDA